MARTGIEGRFLIDSCGWIEYLADGPKADRYAPYIEAADQENSVTSPIIIYEVFKRILGEFGEESAIFHALNVEARSRLVEMDGGLAMKAAEASLEHGMPMADSFIYATAQREGAVVVTGDRHFKGRPGVRFVG